MAYPLEAVAGNLRRIARVAQRLRAWYDYTPTPESRAANELDTAQSALMQEFLTNARADAHLRLAVAEDHLAAIGSCIRDTQTIYSIYSLARTAAELSARAWWLVDTKVTADIRAARMAGGRRHELPDMKRMHIPSVDQFADERIERNKERYEAAGIKPQGPKSATDMLVAMLNDDNLGRVIYSRLSAFTHGQTWALIELMKAGDALADGHTLLAQATTDVAQKGHVVMMALMPYIVATRELTGYLGWDARELTTHLIYTQRGVAQVLATYGGTVAA